LNTKPIIKAVNDELMESIEVVYEPYELDAQEQWMSPETIRKACDNFNMNLEKGVVQPNLFHSKDDEGNYTTTEAFTIEKSWINEVESVIGEQVVPEGTWICKLKWNNEEVWEKRKAGILKGVSLGAVGTIKPPVGED
jgi:hypothetical protein